MKITDIISKSVKPAIYEKGTAFMWSDQHISKHLLNVHLNPEIDLASRKMSIIIKTANWIIETQKPKKKLEILDLGCGPGLYSELFAQKGHNVTGVDISTTSISYAKKSAKDKNLDISYKKANYLELELEREKYDLVTMIYTDLGVLTPTDRGKVLQLVFNTLKKGGVFIFDLLSDKKIEEKITPNNWECIENGFWSPNPYLALSNSFLYQEEKVILYQHIVIEDKKTDTYRFWTHFFSKNDIIKMLEQHQFSDIKIMDDILPPGDIWNGSNVLFNIATK